MNNPLFWFRLLVVLGGIANLIFAILAILVPTILVQLIDVGDLAQPVWLQNVGILLVIISAFYIPAVIDTFRYIFNSVLLVVGRFSAGSFFLILVIATDCPDGFKLLAGTDLILSTLQAVALFFLFRAGDPRRLKESD